MACQLKVKTIIATLHELLELDSEQTPFCEHATMLFDCIAETAVHLLALEHDSLAEERTNLGTTDVEYVTKAGKVSYCEIAGIGLKSISQPCAVKFVAPLVQEGYKVQIRG